MKSDRPQEVLSMLIRAVASGDNPRFRDICQQNAQLIFDHFTSWITVPAEIRADRTLVDFYAQTLISMAHLFDANGYPQLLAVLTHPKGVNPIEQWEDGLAQSQQLVAVGKYEQALALVTQLREAVTASDASGTAVDDFRARLAGMQGTVLFKLERYTEAQAATQSALEECLRSGDQDGIRTYRANLELLWPYLSARPELVDLEIRILEQFVEAQNFADLNRFQASNRLLAALLSMAGDSKQIVDRIRPFILARMGFNEMMLDDGKRAYELVDSARRLCSDRGDAEGADVYRENLGAIKEKMSESKGNSKGLLSKFFRRS